jgi:L-cysteine S-thiosulfotransferase
MRSYSTSILVIFIIWIGATSYTLAEAKSGPDAFRPLTNEPGNAKRGETAVRDANNVTCLICHEIPIKGEPNQGKIGPPLRNIGDRLTSEQIRQKLIYPKFSNPETIMPSYYQISDLNRVLGKYRGKSIYSEQQIEDVITFLLTLKSK